MGEERDTVLALMRKFVAYQYTDTPIMIKSVTYKDGLKGIIYIEAFKQTHVKHAIEGIGSLRMGTYKQQVMSESCTLFIVSLLPRLMILSQKICLLPCLNVISPFVFVFQAFFCPIQRCSPDALM